MHPNATGGHGRNRTGAGSEEIAESIPPTGLLKVSLVSLVLKLQLGNQL